MSTKLVLVLSTLVVVAIGVKFIVNKNQETPRDREVREAVEAVFKVKQFHHKRIVDALNDGATPSDHEKLLEYKKFDVLAIMEEKELDFGIVFDKSDPTKVRMPIVLKR